MENEFLEGNMCQPSRKRQTQLSLVSLSFSYFPEEVVRWRLFWKVVDGRYMTLFPISHQISISLGKFDVKRIGNISMSCIESRKRETASADKEAESRVWASMSLPNLFWILLPCVSFPIFDSKHDETVSNRKPTVGTNSRNKRVCHLPTEDWFSICEHLQPE